MSKITLALSDKTEFELSSYIRTDSELRIIVTSYSDCIDKLYALTVQNLNGYTVMIDGVVYYKNPEQKDVDYARFPQSYEKIGELDTITMFIKLRKAVYVDE